MEINCYNIIPQNVYYTYKIIFITLELLIGSSVDCYLFMKKEIILQATSKAKFA